MSIQVLLRLAVLNQGATPSPPDVLAALTVPAAGSPAGCNLSPARFETFGDTITSRLWAGLEIPGNRWIGNDSPLVATIAERISPRRAVDGPPLPISRRNPARPKGVLLFGRVLATVSGAGTCFRAVEAHVKRLAPAP